jgi:hypothetical protein
MLIKESKLRKIVKEELRKILEQTEEPGMVIFPDSRQEVVQIMRRYLAKKGLGNRATISNIRRLPSNDPYRKAYREWYRDTRGGKQQRQKGSGEEALAKVTGGASKGLEKKLARARAMGDPKYVAGRTALDALDPLLNKPLFGKRKIANVPPAKIK